MWVWLSVVPTRPEVCSVEQFQSLKENRVTMASYVKKRRECGDLGPSTRQRVKAAKSISHSSPPVCCPLRGLRVTQYEECFGYMVHLSFSDQKACTEPFPQPALGWRQRRSHRRRALLSSAVLRRVFKGIDRPV